MEKYNESLKRLTQNGKFYIKLGLDRVLGALNLFNNPQNNMKIIHIAGTNGKGSVCKILSDFFVNSGLKTGLYTSPHIFQYTERIKLNNNDINREEFADYILKISSVVSKNKIELTEFELLTVTAYLYFFEKKVDIAIIETGLGGRFDATNVMESPVLSVITSISYDHMDRLGDNIEKIAFEKAGIIKSKTPVVINQNNLGYKIIKKAAKEKKSEIISKNNKIEIQFNGNNNYAIINNRRYIFNLLGLYQIDNINLVLNAIGYIKKVLKLNINIENILEKTLKNVKWPYRMQKINNNLIVDGAHNIDGAIKLKESLNYYFPNKKIIWLYASLNTKDYYNIVKVLFDKKEDEILLFDLTCENAVKPRVLEKIIGKKIKVVDFEKFYKIYTSNNNKDTIFVICGSFYLIGDVFGKFNKTLQKV